MIIKIDWPSKERTESLQDYHRQNNLLQSAYLKRQSTYPVDGTTLVQGFVSQIRGEVFIVAQPETIGARLRLIFRLHHLQALH